MSIHCEQLTATKMLLITNRLSLLSLKFGYFEADILKANKNI